MFNVNQNKASHCIIEYSPRVCQLSSSKAHGRRCSNKWLTTNLHEMEEHSLRVILNWVNTGMYKSVRRMAETKGNRLTLIPDTRSNIKAYLVIKYLACI
jgi:hypothetical protein